MATADDYPRPVHLFDDHRRVLGQLSHPRSTASLTRAIDADDGAPTLGVGSMDRVIGILDECVDAGWAKNVGNIRKASELHTVPNKDPDVIDIPRESADILRRRARSHRGALMYLDDGDKFILTREGFDLLTGPIPNQPPPLQGPALKAALEQNVRLAAQAVGIERDSEGRSEQQRAAAEEVLARQQAALDAYQEPGDDDDFEDLDT